MPPQITCASAVRGKTRKHENHIFHSIGLCYTQCTCAPSSWEKKLSSVMCLIASSICWDSKIVILSIDFYSRLDEEQLLSFTQSMWITDSRMLCSLPRSCLVHPLVCFDSEGWFSTDQVILLTVFRVIWWKSMQHLSEKTQFLDFLFS